MESGNLNGRDRFYLEQYLLGELRDESKIAHITDDVRQNMENEMKNEDEVLFRRMPVQEFAARVQDRTEINRGPYQPGEGERSGRFLRIQGVMPLAAAALIAVCIGIAGFFPDLFATGESPIERIKGMGPVLNIYRAEGEQARLLQDRALAREDDLLQIEYNAAGFSYGMILSIDGRGTVTLHYPASTSRIPELNTGSVLLPYSYQLDDAPDFERFFFVVSEREFNPVAVLDAARKLSSGQERGRQGSLILPDAFRQYSITIVKEDM